MASFRALFFGLLLLVTHALAARVVFAGKYGKDNQRTTKMQQMPQHKADQTVANMKKWSGGEFKASHGKHNTVQVTNKKPAANRPGATNQVQKMQATVNNNYNPNRNSNKDKLKVAGSKAKLKVKTAVGNAKKKLTGKKTRSLRRRNYDNYDGHYYY